MSPHNLKLMKVKMMMFQVNLIFKSKYCNINWEYLQKICIYKFILLELIGDFDELANKEVPLTNIENQQQQYQHHVHDSQCKH